MFKDTISTYGGVTRFFHWFVGVTIIALLCVGFYMTDLDNSPEKWEIYGLHKATGTVILGVIALRLIWRLVNIFPDLPKTMPNWQARIYRIAVKFMYIFMILMPMSGLLMSCYGGHDVSIYGYYTIKAFQANRELATFFHTIHVYSGIILACMIGAHTSFALYHHFFEKDRLLIRMIVGK